MSDIFSAKDKAALIKAGLLSPSEKESEKPLNKAYAGATSQNTSTLTPKEGLIQESLPKTDRGQETSKETVQLSVRIPKLLKEAHDKQRKGTFNKWVIKKVEEDLR